MISLEEYVIDSKLENYLLNDLMLGLDCRMSMQPQIFGVSESLGNFLNCHKAVYKISKYLHDNIDEDDVALKPEEDKEIIINTEDCDCYCKSVTILLSYTENESSAGFLKVDNEGNVTMHLEIHYTFKIYIENIEGIILHELLHGYEEYNRKKNNKRSLFDEITDEYYNAREKLKSNVDLTRHIAELKYIFNPKERNANFGTLEKSIKELIDKLDPSRFRSSYSKIKKQLQESDIWKRYFEFNKFILNLNNYSDKELEAAYYYVVTDDKKRAKDLSDHIKKIKSGEKDNYKVIKPAKEIRKEVKTVWNKFINKFNQLFAKIYCEHVLDKKEFGISAWEFK